MSTFRSTENNESSKKPIKNHFVHALSKALKEENDLGAKINTPTITRTVIRSAYHYIQSVNDSVNDDVLANQILNRECSPLDKYFKWTCNQKPF